MIDLFHEIPEGVVILRSGGIFRQAKVFRRGDGVYAAWGSGFIRLCGGGGTSSPRVTYDALSAEGVSYDRRTAPKWVGTDA